MDRYEAVSGQKRKSYIYFSDKSGTILGQIRNSDRYGRSQLNSDKSGTILGQKRNLYLCF